MKKLRYSSYLGLLSALLYTGCVVPYDSAATVTVGHYRPGYTVTALPAGYRTAVYGGTRYYYHNDVYYRPQGRGYVVVESPRRRPPRPGDWDRDGRPNFRDPRPGVPDGRVIRRLPPGYRTVHHRGVPYYQVGNVYYRSSGGGYVVVRSPF